MHHKDIMTVFLSHAIEDCDQFVYPLFEYTEIEITQVPPDIQDGVIAQQNGTAKPKMLTH